MAESKNKMCDGDGGQSGHISEGSLVCVCVSVTWNDWRLDAARNNEYLLHIM